MLNERLQILVTKQQRDRLDAEARRRGTSVGAVIRDAVDAQLGVVSRAEKLEAAARIKAMNADLAVSPAELNRMIDEAHEADILAGIPGFAER